MPTRMRVWEIDGEKLLPREAAPFGDAHLENDLEEWIAKDTDLLGEKLLIIARQLALPQGRRLDLLGVDRSGKLVVIELKKEQVPRSAVAQALDYASWKSRTITSPGVRAAIRIWIRRS